MAVASETVTRNAGTLRSQAGGHPKTFGWSVTTAITIGSRISTVREMPRTV